MNGHSNQLASDLHKDPERVALSSTNPCLILVGALTLLHATLFIYDIRHPGIFVNADRAQDRLQTAQAIISTLSSGEPIWKLLSTSGVVGDYAFHAVLYAVGGRFLVILAQCALAIASVAAVYELARMLSRSVNIATTAAAIFGFLPHNIVFPHLLSSEALFTPLIVFGFYLLGRFCFANQSRRHLTLSGTLFGIAALVRPISFPWPLIVSPFLLLCRAAPAEVAKFAAFASVFMLSWMSVIWLLTGHFNEGSSYHDLNSNLYARIYFASEKLPDSQREAARARFLQTHKDQTTGLETASVQQYLGFCSAYPSPCLDHLRTDALAFVAKSGIEKLTVEYLNLTGRELRRQFQDKETGWRSIFESQGIFALMKYFLQLNPVVAISSALGLFGMLCLWVLAFVGIVVTLARWRAWTPLGRLYTVILLVFPLYLFGVSQFVDEMQSRHRAPAEFAIAIFAAIGLHRRRVSYGQSVERSATV